MDKEIRRSIILDNYENKENRCRIEDKDYIKHNSRNVSCIDNIDLYQELNKLDVNEKKILNNRYFLDKTQQETAIILGINQVQVSRCEKKILKKLKSNMQVNI